MLVSDVSGEFSWVPSDVCTESSITGIYGQMAYVVERDLGGGAWENRGWEAEVLRAHE